MPFILESLNHFPPPLLSTACRQLNRKRTDDKRNLHANNLYSTYFTLKQYHWLNRWQTGWKRFRHTSKTLVYYAQKQLCNSKYPACRYKKRWFRDNTSSNLAMITSKLTTSVCFVTPHTIPTPTNLPSCVTTRVHDLSHVSLSCISSTHDQEFKPRSRKQTLAYYTTINSAWHHGKSHTLCRRLDHKLATSEAKSLTTVGGSS